MKMLFRVTDVLTQTGIKGNRSLDTFGLPMSWNLSTMF